MSRIFKCLVDGHQLTGGAERNEPAILETALRIEGREAMFHKLTGPHINLRYFLGLQACRSLAEEQGRVGREPVFDRIVTASDMREGRHRVGFGRRQKRRGARISIGNS